MQKNFTLQFIGAQINEPSQAHFFWVFLFIFWFIKNILPVTNATEINPISD